MLLESLVIGMCLTGYECNYTPRAYYLQNKSFQELVIDTEDKVKKATGPFIGEYVVPYGFPWILMISGKEGTIKITETISFTGSSRSVKFTLQWNF